MKKILFLLLLSSFASNAQIVDIPDANFKAKLLEASPSNSIAQNSAFPPQNIKIDINDDGEIQESEALLVSYLNVSNSNISSIEGINNFQNLREINANNNNLSNVIFEGSMQLRRVQLNNNQFTSQGNISFLLTNNQSSLLNLDLKNNLISSFNLDLFHQSNSINNAPIEINLSDNPIETLIIQNLDNSANGRYTITISNTLLESISIDSNAIADILILNNPLLISIDISASYLSDVFVRDNPLLTDVTISSNELEMQYVDVSNNFSLLNLTLNNLNFALGGEIQIVNNSSLSNVNFFNINAPNDSPINIFDSPISEIVFENCHFYHLYIAGIEVELLDLSQVKFNNIDLDFFYQENLVLNSNTVLKYINLKNGFDNTDLVFSYSNLPELEYVCVNEWDFQIFTNYFQSNFPSVNVNSYCSFTPGGDYNTINGTVHYDTNNNGCDESDFSIPYSRFAVDLDNDTTNSSVFTNSNGVYNIYTATQGEYTLIPVLENPSYFSVSPNPGITVIEEINNSTTILDFCITANGVYSDLEVVIASITPARPGFDAVYKLVYRNKGNQTEVGYVNFNYDETVLSVVSTSLESESDLTYPGHFTWIISDIKPFESGSIEVVFNVNSPTENPAVNIGDVLNFNAFIDVNIDENWDDNEFVLNQTVVGSYDPNDITCLQGDVVSPDQIGEFLHYLIRFENTGNAPAENVVVKTEIDPAQFDINSLQMLSTSHNANIRMAGNKIEFIFQDIQLDSGGHGNILFKMRSNEVLEVGDIVGKKANIYFDYNFPIQTNEAETLFQALSVVNPILDNLISIYPNPVKDIVNITIKDNSSIKTIELYDIQGRLLQTQVVNNITSELNLSSRANGMYFIKINTEKGSKVEKLIKE
ncbi:T9SS type A sorting domain-containing protein [Flavobacterium azooxidireducens]|uniref:T9SS type A sorting domain-containing protein n=1 Tax=Flavobacterium azooxidireducens TaxID=1871076 RepID=A0ABY4KB23_9FLAO|nr:T9SS type A sorting domain-containing protein [Flavobacterium azooxidireducens]UPQ77982.1 T9SS type A sorting domain-containing protein [Flavobacterium azooxidireducens]